MMRAIAVYKLIMNIDKGAASYIANYSGELLTAASKDVKAAKEKVSAVTKGRGAKDKESTENAECGGLCEEISEIEFAVTNGLSGKCRELIEKQLKTLPPENVINEILIPILDRAGRDFEEGVTFLPQLMLCASTAQGAFEVIKQKIEETGSAGESRGTIVIATVQGDIHDIGKNIVKVILENYGYEIIDLGKDVAPQVISDTVKERNVKLLGLSALMTTTLPAMKETIELVKKNSPDCRIMAGGAVLTPEYAKEIGADFYVKDAKESADAAKETL